MSAVGTDSRGRDACHRFNYRPPRSEVLLEAHFLALPLLLYFSHVPRARRIRFAAAKACWDGEDDKHAGGKKLLLQVIFQTGIVSVTHVFLVHTSRMVFDVTPNSAAIFEARVRDFGPSPARYTAIA